MAARIPLEPRVVEITSEISLRTSRFIFLLLLVLLGFEWVVRKRAGMV